MASIINIKVKIVSITVNAFEKEVFGFEVGV
jgi:hypothetical protein